MQVQGVELTPLRLKLMAIVGVALLTLSATIAAQATSLAPADEHDADDDSERAATVNPALTHDQIKFLEDNWYLEHGAILPEADSSDQTAGTPSLSYGDMKFIEDNVSFGLATMREDDRAELLQRARESRSITASRSQAESSLPHPWGGDPLNPAY